MVETTAKGFKIQPSMVTMIRRVCSGMSGNGMVHDARDGICRNRAQIRNI